MRVRKDWKPLVEAARRAGWRLDGASGKRRLRLRSPRGLLVVIPSTPSPGKRSIENKRAELRRAGVEC